MSTTLLFDWDKPPLSLNDRPGHWAARNEEVQDVRSHAADLCRDAILSGDLDVLDPVAVTLVWFAPDRRKRDADNPIATLKAVCDGLVDAGLVPDDTPEWMDKRPVQIVYRKGEPGVELHIEAEAEVVERAARAIQASSGDAKRLGIAWCERMARVALDAARFAPLPPIV